MKIEEVVNWKHVVEKYLVVIGVGQRRGEEDGVEVITATSNAI